MDDVELRSLPPDEADITLLVVNPIGALALEVNTSIEIIVSILGKFVLFDMQPIETSKLFDVVAAFDIESVTRALVSVTANKAGRGCNVVVRVALLAIVEVVKPNSPGPILMADERRSPKKAIMA